MANEVRSINGIGIADIEELKDKVRENKNGGHQ